MSKEFMIARDGQQYGPYSLEDLLQYLKDGQVSLDDSVWSEGMSDWRPLKEIENELSLTAVNNNFKDQPIRETTARHGVSSQNSVPKSDLPSQTTSAKPENDLTVIPDRIRKNLAKYKEHSHLTCLECGYVGLVGHVRTHKKYRKSIIIIAILLCVLGLVDAEISQLQMTMGGTATAEQFGLLFWSIPAVLFVFFSTKKTTILQCPNCEKELIKR